MKIDLRGASSIDFEGDCVIVRSSPLKHSGIDHTGWVP